MGLIGENKMQPRRHGGTEDNLRTAVLREESPTSSDSRRVEIIREYAQDDDSPHNKIRGRIDFSYFAGGQRSQEIGRSCVAALSP